MAIILVPTPKLKALESAREIVLWLESKGERVLLPVESAHQIDREDLALTEGACAGHIRFVVSLGGDGTFLRAARLAASKDVPVLGIKLGGLGFLTEVPLISWQQALERLLDSRYNIEERMLLECRVNRGDRVVFSAPALNDAVIHRGSCSRLLHLNISINHRYVGTYAADGLVISTPTGSTAYSLSSGGPIVHPAMSCFILTAICPHTLSARPLVIPATDVVTIAEVALGGISLNLDGHVNFILEKEDRTQVCRAPRNARFVHLETDFYQIVREKLKWVEGRYAPRTKAVDSKQ